ncbi:MAG: methylmalonyl-CoA mutase family protein, partial [Rhodobacteraceae bacterium]|nr:methylmalonyl-CoA mutase family protein [Paracoccaceae bacterium]
TLAEEQGLDAGALRGTVQNDLIKEYLSRGTYIFDPHHSVNLIADVVEFCHEKAPNWNPVNICSYHLQEAGATPVQEIAYALATATAVLDCIRQRVPADRMPDIVGRTSFFVNAGIRFIGEMCKMRAFTAMWDQLCLERYDVLDSRLRRFRYGVQVNSLGLTEQQPENNAIRILLEMLAVTLSRDARARAVQLPAWNEALGLPRPWDQQWSLRMQQILAYESDLLDHDDLFTGNAIIEDRVHELMRAAGEELARIDEQGGAIEAIEYMKNRLVESNAERLRRIESGETTVVGVNRYTESHPSPLLDGDLPAMTADDEAEQSQIDALREWRRNRDGIAVENALDALRKTAQRGDNIMSASIDAARAGVTTGEWSDALRAVFGEYRSPTGVSSRPSNRTEGLDALRDAVDSISQRLGKRMKLLVGKPGLDGHSNGAEQIVYRARDCGMQICYAGIRHTPEDIVKVAKAEDVHVIGLSILSGSHVPLVQSILDLMRHHGIDRIPLVVGGIIPDADQKALLDNGVARIFTPRDYNLNSIMAEIIELVSEQAPPAGNRTDDARHYHDIPLAE